MLSDLIKVAEHGQIDIRIRLHDVFSFHIQIPDEAIIRNSVGFTIQAYYIILFPIRQPSGADKFAFLLFCEEIFRSQRPGKPKNFDKMIDIARMLSKDLEQVRVDLYNIEGKIYFGELTLYHSSGLDWFEPYEWDKKIGDWW